MFNRITSAAIAAMLLLCAVSVKAQTKSYKEYEVCTQTELHKGKVDHNKPYCVAWVTVREYKDGKKDTVAWMGGGKMFIGDEYKQYQKLSERGKYIVDSLKEDGIPMYQNTYLTYEPIYMKSGKETYKSWKIVGTDIRIYYYSIWNTSKGNGFELLKELVVK